MDDNAFSDILFACRGSGGNFGFVATHFTFQCHDCPNAGTLLYGSVVSLALSASGKMATLLAWWKLLVEAPGATTLSLCVLPCGATVVPTLWSYTTGRGMPNGRDAVLQDASAIPHRPSRRSRRP